MTSRVGRRGAAGLASVCALLCALALIATPAFAAPPETPVVTVKPIFASVAVFNGTMKGRIPVGDSFRFLYKESKTECAGGSETTPGIGRDAPEVILEQVRGLTPSTEYTVCLQISDAETATSSPVTFKTAAAVPPETPQALPPSKINATSATLNGVINPHHEGEPGRYSFVYAESPSVCTEGQGTAEETMRESSPQPVSLKADSLQPNTTYTVCLKATNAREEATLSAPVTFTTTSLPEMRTVEPVTNITGTTAILHGVLDPKAASPEALVEYDFFYVYAGESTCNEPIIVKPVPEPPGVASGAMGEAVEASLSGLTPGTEYAVCLGARNTGEAFDFEALSAPVKFKTLALAPNVISESVAERWATAVLLETRVNNEAEPTECFFQYGEASVSEHEVSCGNIERGYEEHTLRAKVEGLTAGHTYHWRTVAKNKTGTTDGNEESFTTATNPEPPELSVAPFAWSPWVGVAMTAPANASSEPKVLFDWGACPTAGYCAGVGSYKDENENEEAMAATRIDGAWGQAVQITLPPGAAMSGQKAGFGFPEPSVACTEPGECVAVGHYIKEGGGEAAMVVAETGGVWGTASEIKSPSDAASNPQASLGSLACPAAGSCVARGEYSDENGDREAMVAVETNGSWGKASAITLPANAASSSRSYVFRSFSGSVACSAAGSCVATGEYRNQHEDWEAMVVSETGGKWGRASQIALPANAASASESRLDSAVCVASGPCVAGGSYIDRSGDREVMVAEETGGSWGPASEIQAPSNVAVDPQIGFGLAPMPIACAASGSCVITAKYTDSSGAEQAMVANETGGVWGPASEVVPPTNAATSPRTVLDPACTASGACVLAGEYTDAGGNREAMVVYGKGGSWGPASEVGAPKEAATNPEIIFGEVQCPAVGSCVAFGEYTNHTGATRDMEVTGLEAPENTAAPIVSGMAKVGQTLTCSQGTWIGASPISYTYRWLRDGAAIGGAESNTYTVTTADEGHSISCEVTATNAVGSKSAASANNAAIHEEAREKREAEEALAAKKHLEETPTKKQEEAKIAAAGSVSLASSVISVQSGGKASVKLTCTGTATCAGKLTLTVTVKGKGKGKHGKKAKAIGTAAFSIPADKTEGVTITLTAAGRALLKADHGRLSASLTILESSPAPASTKRESVTLVQKKATKAKKRKR